ncbi:MAG: type II CRISPR RNA-guided endonuclease Cas9 [Gammaproteobacteria bacterium]|nr:type II CRISPR RNA-guided endonuclease Cas9 [Gammaproteobacteria bacterium]
MAGKLRYRLGLDIGSTSIGWCMVRLDTDDKPCAVIRAGVRIFSDGRNPKDGSSLAVTRRQARAMRRRRDRLLKRKERLLGGLIELGFFPPDPVARKALANLDPYQLRRKGLYEQLTGPEFARALFHLNQRRGFQSNRKTDKADKESGLLKSSIRRLREELAAQNCQTLGEWLAKRHDDRLSVRARLRGKTQRDKAYDFYADRAMVEHEFDALWQKQSQFSPQLFTSAAYTRLKDILLFQRALKPVIPGRCTLIPHECRAPAALPSSQFFRIYQEANNLRLLADDLAEQPLSLSQRDTIVEALKSTGHRTFTQLRKALGLGGRASFNLEDIKRDRLKGNATAAILAREEMFGDRWHGFTLNQQDDIVTRLLEEPSESEVVKWLQEEFGLDEMSAERVANADLPEGYINLGRTAVERILPHLQADVITYDKAVVAAGFTSHSAGLSGHAAVLDELPYYGNPLQRHVGFGSGNPDDSDEKRYGRIANPTVHIGLNELRKVVNALIKRYGRPAEIVVELARELKMSRRQQLEIQKEQREREKLNEQHVTAAAEVRGLDVLTLTRSQRRELSQRMQLWVELNPSDVADRRCPYTGEQINIEKLLTSEVEIEHILPFSRTLDDSMNNKTVAMRRANRDKGNLTPYGAFGEREIAGYDYEAILVRAARMPKQKAKRFAPDGYERWLNEDKDFLARALNDTAYLSRIAKEYLCLICPPNRVRAIPGRLTALLRGKFGLNELLSGSSFKNRDDHRHHAIDAAVVAVTDQGLLTRVSTASARARTDGLERLIEEMPWPWTTFRNDVARAISAIKVSHRPDHGYQGSMHEETAWGFREDGRVTRRTIAEDGVTRVREFSNKKLVPITSTKDANRHARDESGAPLPYKGYVGGSNYALEVFKDEKGKFKGNVVSTFEAYQIVRAQGADEGLRQLRNPHFTQSGAPLVMRLMIGDVLKLVVDGVPKLMRIAVISGNGQVFMAAHNEANVDARNRDKNSGFKYISKMAGSLVTACARHVSVSPIGDLQLKGQRY